MALTPIPEVLDLIRAGKMYILVDDPDRENEGDLCIAAEFVMFDILDREGDTLVNKTAREKSIKEYDIAVMD